MLGKVRGAADVNVEKVSGLAYLQIEIDRDKIARYGINVADVQNVVETAIGGKEASKVYEGMKVFGLAVRFPEDGAQRRRADPGYSDPVAERRADSARATRESLCHAKARRKSAARWRSGASSSSAMSPTAIIGSFVAEAKQKIDAQ